MNKHGSAQARSTATGLRSTVVLFSVFAVSSAVHEAVMIVAMRRTCWPFSTVSLMLGGVVLAIWDVVYPVESLLTHHPPVGSTPPPPPPPTPLGSVSKISHLSKGIHPSNAPVNSPSPTTSPGGTHGCLDDEEGEHNYKPGSRLLMGREWRGWGAVAFYMGTSCPVTLLFDFLAWQWWRHTFLLATAE